MLRDYLRKQPEKKRGRPEAESHVDFFSEAR